MYPYTYKASLRAEHPSLDLGMLSGIFGLTANRTWNAGNFRATPTGRRLDGIYRKSYWTASLTDNWKSSKSASLEKAIDEWLNRLQQHAFELDNFFATGGRLNFFIGVAGKKNFGITLPIDLLGRLASLRIELQLDIYPEDEQQFDHESLDSDSE